jgi:hypothetical protein
MSPSLITRVKSWYEKFERPISSLSLIGGFVFDAVTLTRVDEFWENVWVGVHLFIVAVCIILVNLQENEDGDEANANKIHFWLLNALQWFFGGLLSTYLVFYFRSGTLAVSWPFFVILAAAFVANERLKKHCARLTFQISILFLSIILFSIYIVPVMTHTIGMQIFILSGIISLVIIGLFLWMLKLSAKEKFKKSRLPLALSIAGITAALNLLYFFNLIPPLPISLKDAGIYQSLAVNAPGNYTVQYENQGIFGFLRPYEDVHVAPNAALYAYTAVFSPASFSLKIIHEWQYYDETTKSWVTRGRIALATNGGTDLGYRTFSAESNFASGKWRVNIKTPQGQIIGRLTFNVVVTSTPPSLQTRQID